jgi:hypothetical protein
MQLDNESDGASIANRIKVKRGDVCGYEFGSRDS